MSVAADEADRRPRDMDLEPLVDGTTRITWSEPEAGAPLAYHVFRARVLPPGEEDWALVGTTTAGPLIDPEHRPEDDLIQGYRVVAEFADGAGVAEVFGVIRFPPGGAVATAGQNIIRIHAAGAHGCYLLVLGDIPPTQTPDDVECWVEGLATFLPGPAREATLCGFYTVWNVVQPVAAGAGAGLGGTSQTMGGQGCVEA